MSDWLKILKEYVDTLETLIGTIDAATTDSLHGKLGTDTELADYSLYDLLGGNAFKTNALSAMLGAFTTAQNLKAILGNLTTTKNLGGILGALTTTNNLLAVLGAYTAAAPLKAAIDAIPTVMVGTDDAALASVLGALNTAAAEGAVTDADEAMAYIKQLVTELQVVDSIVDTITGHITADYGATEKTNINHITADYAAAQKGVLDDWINAGRLDAILDDILLDTGTTIPGAMALASVLGALDAATGSGAVSDAKVAMTYLKQLVTELIVVNGIVDTITGHITADYGATEKTNINHITADYGATEKTNINHITADYAAAQKGVLDDWINAGRLDAILDDILLDTGTTIPGAMALASVLGALNAATASGAVDDVTVAMGYLKQLVTELIVVNGIVDTITGHITADYGATEKTNINHITADYAAAQKGVLDDWINDGRLDAILDAVKVQTDKIAGKMLFSMDFWSPTQEEVEVTAAGATETLPSIEVAEIPDGATIVRAVLMFKFRMIENTYADVNKLNGATVAGTSQVIQVQDSGESGWFDAILLVDDFFTLASETREGGDILIGSVDVAARVDENDTYSVTWLVAKADQDFILFNDVQVGLRIWYSL